MRTHPPRWLTRLGRVVMAMAVAARRREEVEGDLAELWEHRANAGRRDLRRAYVRDVLGLATTSRLIVRRAGASAARSRPAARGLGLGQDVRYAWRVIRRRPAAAVASVLTLAIGIGAGTAIFTAVDRLLVRPLPFPDPDRLVHVVHPPLRFADTGGMVPRSFLDLPVIAAAGVWASGGANLETRGQGIRVAAAAVDDGFFAALAVPPLVGQTLPRADARAPFVVLSYELWQRHFNGDRAAVGAPVAINGRSFTVAGVMPPGFVFPGRSELWVPPLADLQLTGAAFAPEVLARIAPGVTIDQARAAIAAYESSRRAARGLSGPAPADEAMAVGPLAAQLTRESRPTLLLLAASVTLLLLVVCASVAHLMLARVAAREREFAVRLALGASRWRVARQLFVECLVLSGIAAVLGVLGGGWTLHSLRVLAPETLGPFSIGVLDVRPLALALGVSLVATVLFGAAPGLAAASGQVEHVARTGRDDDRRTPAWRRIRGGLVVGQMALALMLLTASAAAVAALVEATRVDVGFGSPRALAFTVTLPLSRFDRPPAIADFFARAHERLAAVPGVRRVGATGFLPGSKDIGVGLPFRVAGRPAPPDDQRFFASYLSATADYFAAMGIRVVAGRPILPSDAIGAPSVIVLSETTARHLFPSGENPIGQRIETSRPGRATDVYEVVGIVADVHYRAADATARDLSQVYVPLAQRPPFGNLSFVAEMAGAPADGIAAIRAALRDVDPSIPIFNPHAVDAVVDRYLASYRLAGVLISAFAVVTLLVAAIGLSGLMAQRVTDRRREIGIRLALGAPPAELGRRILRDGTGLALAGAGLGTAAGFAALRAFAAVAPIRDDVSPWMFAANAAILLATAVAATWHPASRAVNVDPVSVLRGA
jgi:predicted permease